MGPQQDGKVREAGKGAEVQLRHQEGGTTAGGLEQGGLLRGREYQDTVTREGGFRHFRS